MEEKNKTKILNSLDSETWDKIQDEIREKVLKKEFELNEKLSKEQIQEINLQVLEDMTDILTLREIEEIAAEVSENYLSGKRKNSLISLILWHIQNIISKCTKWILNWLNINKTTIISIIITGSICYFVPRQFDEKEQIYAIMIMAFPFIIILFGIIYTVLSMLKTKK